MLGGDVRVAHVCASHGAAVTHFRVQFRMGCVYSQTSLICAVARRHTSALLTKKLFTWV